MARKTSTPEYAVLGMLAGEPGSGYDLKKRIEGSIAHFWQESYGQIYPMLKRMAAQGLVKARIERTNGKPDRQVYSLTQSGRAELEAWMGQPPAVPSPRNELLLKLFFGARGKTEDMVRHVEGFSEQSADGDGVGAHPPGPLRRQRAQFRDEPARLVEVLFRFVAAQPFFQ